MTTKKKSVKAKSKPLKVRVIRLPHGDGLPLPSYQSEEAAGLDLIAAVPDQAPLTLSPGARALVPTGLILELPRGSEAQVRPRSGLAFKHGVTVLNSPGTIDSDYRGEVQVLLINLGQAPFVIARGERIAQLVVAPVTRAKLKVKDVVSETSRGAGGFGSTGSASKRPKTPATKKSDTDRKPTAKRKSGSKPPAPGKRGVR